MPRRRPVADDAVPTFFHIVRTVHAGAHRRPTHLSSLRVSRRRRASARLRWVALANRLGRLRCARGPRYQPSQSATLDPTNLARARWLTLLPTIEGVAAKRADSRYDAGSRRDWVKLKRYRTAD